MNDKIQSEHHRIVELSNALNEAIELAESLINTVATSTADKRIASTKCPRLDLARDALKKFGADSTG